MERIISLLKNLQKNINADTFLLKRTRDSVNKYISKAISLKKGHEYLAAQVENNPDISDFEKNYVIEKINVFFTGDPEGFLDPDYISGDDIDYSQVETSEHTEYKEKGIKQYRYYIAGAGVVIIVIILIIAISINKEVK